MPLIYGKNDEPVPGYRLVEPLGQGGFGSVWKAIGPGGVLAAVKIINLVAKHAHKELRAIQRVKQIRHPNLVPISGVWLKDKDGILLDESVLDPSAAPSSPIAIRGTMVMPSEVERPKPAQLIIAMGLGDKQLADRLQECQEAGQQGIPPEELLDYMEAAARGIDHLNSPRHPGETGLVAIQHCDIKPQNIMIVSGVAQVCDFGLARVLGEAPTLAAATYAYGAPEFLKDQRPSHATDQYSLAITYIELRTGSLPFPEDEVNPLAIYNAHLEGKLDYSRVPPAELAVLQRATARQPPDRYATTMDFVRALRRAFEKRATVLSVKPGSVIVPGHKLIRRISGSEYDEIWEAAGPAGKHKALVLRRLSADQGRIDLKALHLISNISHPHLTELEACWLLDAEGSVIPEDMWDKPEGSAISMLVIAGKIANKTLLHRIEECRKETGSGIPLPELLDYMRQVAAALDFANTLQHSLGGKKVAIQHRDVRPANIVFHVETVKLGNYAMARVLEGNSISLPGDDTGWCASYAAPELSENRTTRWSDQYSLAITYLHARTGQLPWDVKGPTHEITEMHQRGTLDFGALPENERPVVSRATSIVPEERFENCESMVRSLYEACGMAEVASPPASPPEAAAPSSWSPPAPPESDVVRTMDVPQSLAQPKARFGLNHSSTGDLVENELEQEVIRLMEQLRASGMTTRQILEALNLLGSSSASEGAHATIWK